MVSRMPIGCTDGARRPPEGSQNRPTSGNTGVSSYSRVVFWYAKMVQFLDSMDSMDSMDLRICRYPGWWYGCPHGTVHMVSRLC